MSDRDDADTPAIGAAPRRGRWLHWALAASVALNLLFAGLGAGMLARAHMGEGARAFLHGDGFRARDSRSGDRSADGGDDRRAFRAQARAVLDARAPAFRAGRARVADAWRAVRAAAEDAPLQTARLEAALADLRAAQAALTLERDAALVALAGRLSPQERARVMREMERLMTRERRDR